MIWWACPPSQRVASTQTIPHLFMSFWDRIHVSETTPRTGSRRTGICSVCILCIIRENEKMRLLFWKIFGNSLFFLIISRFFTELLSCQNFVDKKFLPPRPVMILLFQILCLQMKYWMVLIAMRWTILQNQQQSEKKFLLQRKNIFHTQKNTLKTVMARIDIIMVLLIERTRSLYLPMIEKENIMQSRFIMSHHSLFLCVPSFLGCEFLQPL